MKKRCERLYISPAEFAAPTDSAAFQAAVAEAKRLQVNVMVVTAKPDGTAWHLTEPVALPSYFTVIISGCAVHTKDVAFVNEDADAVGKTLACEAHKIFILGRKGAKLIATGDKPQIRLAHARDCRIAGLAFEGGAGIALNHLRYSKLQMLSFRGCAHAVTFAEGCNNIILESVDAETEKEAIFAQGGASRILVRDPDICNSILCRIRVKTQGAAAVALIPGQVDLYNIVLRDLTDETEGTGTSVVLGSGSDAGQIQDLTVRGVRCGRNAVHTRSLCDGNFYSNLHPGEGCKALVSDWKNTRELLEDKTMEMVLPQFREELPDQAFVTPNDPKFFADGDAATIQNAIDYARAEGIRCVVIPCWNVRMQQARWDIEATIRIPSYINIVLLHSHLRHTDFMYGNIFANSRAYDFEDRNWSTEEHDMAISGVGDAVLDGGKHNGLKEKTCFLFGLPDKRYNATVRFDNVRNMVLENFQIRNSRWYGTYFIHCDTVRVSGLDFDNTEQECNRDGVDVRQGNHNFLIENITGTTGDDTVALNNLGNDGNDGRYVKGKDYDTLNMVIRNVKSDAGRWFTVRLLTQDRHLEQHFTLDTIMDVSLPEDKDRVDAVVVIGSHEYHYKIPAELGDLAHLTIRDVYSRANYGVALGGCNDDIDISNVHTYADGISVFGVRGGSHGAAHPSIIARVRDIRVNGLFHKRNIGPMEADDLLAPSRIMPANAISLGSLITYNPIQIENVFIDTAACGVVVNGRAEVEIKNMHMENVTKAYNCRDNCRLRIDDEEVDNRAVTAD